MSLVVIEVFGLHQGGAAAVELHDSRRNQVRDSASCRPSVCLIRMAEFNHARPAKSCYKLLFGQMAHLCILRQCCTPDCESVAACVAFQHVRGDCVHRYAKSRHRESSSNWLIFKEGTRCHCRRHCFRLMMRHFLRRMIVLIRCRPGV
jgi:hypothetical protein